MILQKTFGEEYLEKGTDVVRGNYGGYLIVGEQCVHNYDIFSCDNKTKVMVLEIDENGNQTKLEYINDYIFMSLVHMFPLQTQITLWLCFCFKT